MDVLTTLILCLASVLFFGTAEGYFITIDAHAEECFFDKVTSGTKMSLMFEVAEGGFLDIDVKVRTGFRLYHLRNNVIKWSTQRYWIGLSMCNSQPNMAGFTMNDTLTD